MNFFKKHRWTIGLAASVLAIGASSAVVFGLSVVSSNVNKYVNIEPYQTDTKRAISYSSTQKLTTWNCGNEEPTDDTYAMKNLTCATSLDDLDDAEKFYKTAEIVTSGSQSAILDRSFTQSVYKGMINWIWQKQTEWKPSDITRANPTMNITLTDCKEPNQSGTYLSGLGVKPIYDDATGYVKTYTQAINDPSNNIKYILCTGYTHATGLSQLEKTDPETFNKAGYIFIDGGYSSQRVASVSFRADQSAFLAGLTACQYLQDHYDSVFSKVNGGQLAAGAFGGTPIPTVTIYMGGFQLGIWAYNNFVLPNLDGYDTWTQEQKEKRTVKFVGLGMPSSYFSGTFVAGDARLIVQELLATGADVIIPVAATQIIDLCSEIENQHSPAKVIGVDTDQENSDFGIYKSRSSLDKGEQIIIFSAEKDLGLAANLILQAATFGYRGFILDEQGKNSTKIEPNQKITSDPTIAERTIGGFGYSTVANLRNKCVKISKKGHTDLIKAVKLMYKDKKVTIPEDYDSLIAWLSSDEAKLDIKGHNETLLAMLDADENMCFHF